MIKQKSIKNFFWAFASNITSIAISFFAQRIFLSILNTEYLGLNGLFSNIISMLSIFELGIGTAITFSLYEPIAKNDKQTIKALMNFYRKAYRIVVFVIAFAGVLITPFLNYFIKEVTIDINIYIVYLMFIADTVFSYVLAYRRSILYADRKNYIINITHIGYLLITNTCQLLMLAITHNYYLYLAVKIIMHLTENIAIHLIAKKQYPYLNNINENRLDKKIEKEIFKKIRALLFHKIGSFIVLGSDNIIISKYIGLIEVGLYSNYYIIINAINIVIGQAISALTPSVGHMLIKSSPEEAYEAFRKVRFAGFFMALLASTVFAVSVQPFIRIWLGEQYLLGTTTIVVLSINMFQKLQRYAYNTFKEAAGIFHEDRFVPLVESVINIVASIVLLNYFGIAGVFIGTIVSGLVLWGYSYPRFVYKKLFKRSYKQYLQETVGYIILFSIVIAAALNITGQISISSTVGELAANAATAIVLSLLLVICLFHKNDSFKYFETLLKRKK